MRFLFVFIALASELQGFAQVFEASGSVKTLTSKPIPFVAISIPSKNLFFSTDSTGHFKITSRQIELSDTVFISCVGYITNRFVARDMVHSNLTLKLADRVQVLDAVAISVRKAVVVKVGSKRESVGNSIASMPGREIAMFMKGSENLNGSIQSVGFFLREHSGVSSLRGDAKAPYRIRLFACDSKTGKPGKELIEDVIITSATHRNAWHDVDLSSYQIASPMNGFFVCFSLLPEEYYKFFQSKGSKIGMHHNFGLPYLGVTGYKEFKESLSYNYESYQGRWRLNSFVGNFTIRDEVKLTNILQSAD